MADKEMTFADFEKGKKKSAKKAAKGKASHFRLERADNGFISHTEHEMKPSANKGAYPIGMEDMQTRMVHPDIQHAADHMTKMFGGAAAEPKEKETPAEEKAEGAEEE